MTGTPTRRTSVGGQRGKSNHAADYHEEPNDAAGIDDVVVPIEVLSESLSAEECVAGAVLTVAMRDGELVAASYNAAETRRRRARSQARFDRLSRRPDEPRDT